jgi:endonuclease YncB( thermonuclease family)
VNAAQASLVIRAVLLAAALAFGPARAGEWTLSGRVVALKDGDSFVVLDGKTQHPIRIAGIDAPEHGQPYGNASKRNLSRHIFNRNVAARCYKRDRFGRNVCRVFVDRGQDVGLEQVRAGLAWWLRDHAIEQTPEEQGGYQGAEDAARVTRRGLWKDAKPVPPWEWRAVKR